MKHQRFLTLALAVGGAALMFPTATHAAPDRIVHHQGRLVDSNGLPLEGTLGRLTFRLYSTAAPSSATFVWGEVHEGVRVARGVYTVPLGGGTSALDAAGNETPGGRPFTGEFDGGPRYLEVQVEADAPLGPLTRVGSVPHAITADGAVPIGTVVDWYRPSPGTPVPAGWQVCDGAAVTDPDSPMAGLATPNLVGRFVRGLDPSQVTATSYGAGTATPLPDAGGSASASFSHSHGMSHTHAVPAHTHPMPHTHGATGRTGGADQNPPQDAGSPSYQGGPFFHQHDFSVTTGQPSVASTGANSATQTGDSSSSRTGTEGVTIGTLPPYVGLLKIIRVR